MNITVSIDDELSEKVRKIAADKNTTLTAMVREYFNSVADTETPEIDSVSGEEAVEKLRALWASIDNRRAARDRTAGEEAADKLRENINQLKRPMGPRNWTRDDLYDRPKAYFKRD